MDLKGSFGTFHNRHIAVLGQRIADQGDLRLKPCNRRDTFGPQGMGGIVAHINLVKLCVGAEKVEDLILWQGQRAKAAEARGEAYLPYHTTRMWPKRANELLAGGSLYWVFKGFILARQLVLRLDEDLGNDGITRCRIVMSRDIIRTQAAARRPFQGWRYLTMEDAPPDLPKGRESDDELPEDLSLALADIGLR